MLSALEVYTSLIQRARSGGPWRHVAAQACAGELAAEKARLETQADALARIVAEQEGLLADATAYLQKLREKSAALAEGYRRLMERDRIPAR